MNMKYIVYCLVMTGTFSSCEKYLEEKPQKELTVPTNIQDLQALLDTHETMNEKSPPLGELMSDNFILKNGSFIANNPFDRALYTWDEKATHLNSWKQAYQNPVYYANVVLDQLDKIKVKDNEMALFKQVKGAALFYKAFAYQRLADLYAPPYSEENRLLPGIVMRRTSNIQEVSYRATTQETYDVILSYLQEASNILPDQTAAPTRPTRVAALGLLARTMLAMRDYTGALKYSDEALKLRSSLMDFNTIMPGMIPRFNEETIFYNHVSSSAPMLVPVFGGRVNPDLPGTYQDNDLRKKLYFMDNGDGTFTFQGSYDADYTPFLIFDGITVDEMMLIKAECQVRSGDFKGGLKTLDGLLVTRWLKDPQGKSTYVEQTAANASEALEIVLRERRKELVFRGLRWSDIRRLNLEGRNIELVRQVNDNVYKLPPNDKRSVLLIPLEVISLTGIPQTSR